MVAFPTARQAVLCAVDIQRALLRRAARGDFPIQVRIGIHTGEAIRHGQDFFGRSVVLAARIADHAEGGEVLLSALVNELVAGRGDIVTRPAGNAEFKGSTAATICSASPGHRPTRPSSRRNDRVRSDPTATVRVHGARGPQQ